MQVPAEQAINFVSIDVLETLDMYPDELTVSQIEKVLGKYIEAQNIDLSKMHQNAN